MGIQEKVHEYSVLRGKAKTIKSRMDSLAKEIKMYLTNSVDADSKGSYYTESDSYIYGSQAKKSMKINEERATNLLGELKLLDKVLDTKTFINEDKLSNLVSSGDLSMEDFETLIDTKTTYSIDIKEKEKEEDMPVIQTASSSKSRKKLPTRR